MIMVSWYWTCIVFKKYQCPDPFTAALSVNRGEGRLLVLPPSSWRALEHVEFLHLQSSIAAAAYSLSRQTGVRGHGQKGGDGGQRSFGLIRCWERSGEAKWWGGSRLFIVTEQKEIWALSLKRCYPRWGVIGVLWKEEEILSSWQIHSANIDHWSLVEGFGQALGPVLWVPDELGPVAAEAQSLIS